MYRQQNFENNLLKSTTDGEIFYTQENWIKTSQERTVPVDIKDRKKIKTQAYRWMYLKTDDLNNWIEAVVFDQFTERPLYFVTRQIEYKAAWE